jgi:CRISPR-associated protein Csd2
MPEPITNRYDFVFLFDVQDGNPNGDPDAGNLPRVDSVTGHGLVTDVCLKRKIRNYVGIVKGEQPPYEIYVKEGAVLNRQHERAYKALKIELESGDKRRKGGGEDVERARQWMCGNFYDVRTFGAVMGTEVNAGHVRGPVQITFARSVDPIVSLEHAITRMAVTSEKDYERQKGEARTMGRKATIPYGLYRAHGFVSASLAAQTGFDVADLELLWAALREMFDHDRSAARGLMSTRGLYVFKHESTLGNAPATVLFDRITVKGRDPLGSPRGFQDYEVSLSRDGLPHGVTLNEMC